MEALAVVGLASNILQFTDYGYKAVKLAKELHESSHNTTQSNAEATFVAQEMRELGLKLTKDLPTANLTDDEDRLCQLAKRCSLLSNKLLLLLESLKIVRSKRKFETIKAAFRNLRKRKERDELQADLDNCRAQLNLRIAHMSRSDFARKLEATLISTTQSHQDILYLRDHVQKLQQKLTADSATIAGFFRELQEVIETPLRQNAILHSIRYPRMYDRFNNVEPAHRKTFEWLLQGPLDHSSSERQEQKDTENYAGDFSDRELTTMKYQAKCQKHKEFVHWLQKGVDPSGTEDDSTPRKESIYHIVGKPGAGKSTLMKFLCENQTTIDHLKTWAGEKRLICAKAFFWRLGEEEQKNLTGLRNCLLHQILTAAPELIPIAFPSVWESGYRDLSYLPTDTALNFLLKDSPIFEKYKMVFFIDGLDEYQGRPTELIKRIIGWTAGNSADLKICLSSRELNDFEVGFKDCARLRIQEWTRDDIQIFVQDNFGDMSDLSTSISKGDLNTIASVIVDKAEGVFLWVRVVLAAIEQGVLNGDDLQDLQRKTDAFPVELRDLYQHLFNSIPEYDRRKAFEALSFALHISSTPKPLLQYKFLGDVAKSPDFAMNMSTQPLSEDELRKIATNASRQIKGRCKGFLEVFSPEKPYYRGDEHVRLMHSTAAEFLHEEHVRDTMKSYLIDMDIFDWSSQTFLALAKSLNTDSFFKFPDTTSIGPADAPFIAGLERIIRIFDVKPQSLLIIQGGRYRKDRFLDLLGKIDQIATLRYEKRGPLPLRIDLIYRTLPKLRFVLRLGLEVLPNQIVLALAARLLLVEYFDSGGLCNLRALATKPEAVKQIAQAVMGGASEYSDGRRSFQMFKMLFEAGISPEVSFEMQREDSTYQCQLWSWVFTRLIFTEWSWERARRRNTHLAQEGSHYKLIELFLRYGAGEDIGLMFGPCFEVTGANRLIVLIRVCQSNGSAIPIPGLRGMCVDYQLDIVRHARSKGGLLSLRDILVYCFPRDSHHLFALLDGKSSTLSTSDDIDKMPMLFPTENRYFEDMSSDKSMHYVFDDKRPPKHCKQCLEHSEKCFTDFEARLQNEGPGLPYKLKHPSTYDDED